jgi:hypothetical protein
LVPATQPSVRTELHDHAVVEVQLRRIDDRQLIRKPQLTQADLRHAPARDDPMHRIGRAIQQEVDRPQQRRCRDPLEVVEHDRQFLVDAIQALAEQRGAWIDRRDVRVEAGHGAVHRADQIGKETNRIVVALIEGQPRDGVRRRGAPIPLGEQCRLARTDRRSQYHELASEDRIEAGEQRSSLDASSGTQRRLQLGIDQGLRPDRTHARGSAGQELLRFYGTVGGAFAGERIVHGGSRAGCKPYNSRAGETCARVDPR